MVTKIPNTPAAWTDRARAARTSWEAARWSLHGQTQRMLATVRHLQPRPGETVLDYGCGTGRLLDFLPSTVMYVGYDSAPGMVERAAREHPRGVFTLEEPAVRFDHVAAIGVFNLVDGWNPVRTLAEIERLWAVFAKRTLAVSLLRTVAPGCIAYGPAPIAALAERLADSFTVDCSYLPNDLMLVLRR